MSLLGTKMVLKNKKILLGITGSVAAYKSVDLTRRLVEEGASVHVVMTNASKNFITPLSLEIASRNEVFSDLFADPMAHISLAADADVLAVAPATANIIGKFAGGIADDLLSTCLLVFRGNVVLAPAMNWRMYENPMVQRNLGYLSSLGVAQVGPEKGSLACGDEGIGRMADVSDVIEAIRIAASRKDLRGRKFVVTAGPTREYLDPVRFISNRSSGKMGLAVARAAVRRGAKVVLICGPAAVKPPSFMEVIEVETAFEMRMAVLENLRDCDALVMSAAVSDFAPVERSGKKIEKGAVTSIELKKTPDILAEVGAMANRPIVVGFSAETGPEVARAAAKRAEKGADVMVFNNVSSPGSGFDVDTNEITIIGNAGVTSLPLMTKDEAADAILDGISKLFLDFS